MIAANNDHLKTNQPPWIRRPATVTTLLGWIFDLGFQISDFGFWISDFESQISVVRGHVGEDLRGLYGKAASWSALKGRNIPAQGKRGGVQPPSAALGLVLY